MDPRKGSINFPTPDKNALANRLYMSPSPTPPDSKSYLPSVPLVARDFTQDSPATQLKVHNLSQVLNVYYNQQVKSRIGRAMSPDSMSDLDRESALILRGNSSSPSIDRYLPHVTPPPIKIPHNHQQLPAAWPSPEYVSHSLNTNC